MKLSIYHGTINPFIATGKNQCRLLEFAFKYPEWHSFNNDKPTARAIKSLADRGCIILNEYDQFKINLGA